MDPIEAANTIVYCADFAEAVSFYRDGLGLRVTFASDWFVELELAPNTFLSVADASRTSIEAGDGRGITLSWRVVDLAATRAALLARGIDVGPVTDRFGSPTADLFDPVGNRIELWSTS